MRKRLLCAVLAGLMVLVALPLSAFAVARYEVLMIGDENAYVTELQEALYDKGYLKVKPTGYFGTNTQKAVLDFQKDNGLVEDGKAGPATRKALLGNAYKDIPDPSADSSVEEPVDMKMLFSGSEGPEVEKLQTRLKELGYYTYSKITGYFGPITKDAVERFQRDNGLTVDGIAGEKTLTALYSQKAERSYLAKGDEGSDVVKLQDRLKELNYFSGKSTGYFGTITDAAVREFQKNNSLTVDGKVGEKTSAVLYSDKAIAKQENTDTEKDSDGETQTEQKNEQIEKFISLALKQEGKPYVWGDEGPNSFDCSGLVYYCLRNSGVSVGRKTAKDYSQTSSWKKVTSMSDLKRGDLLFFKSDTVSSVNHTGIYLGSGKMIHASSSNKKVVIAECNTSYWKRNFVNGRRVFED